MEVLVEMATKSVIRSNSKRKHYIVVYKGDDAIAQGYADDVAKELNIAYSTLSFMLSPTYKKRVNTREHRLKGYTTVVDLDENPKMPAPKRVANYYLRHSAGETAEHYNCSIETVFRYFRQVHGCSKYQYLKKQN